MVILIINDISVVILVLSIVVTSTQAQRVVDIMMELLLLSASVDLLTGGPRPPQWTALHLAEGDNSKTGDTVAVMEAHLGARANPMAP